MNKIRKKTEYFKSITVECPRLQIYSRLGFARGKTKLSTEKKKRLDALIDEAVALINLKAAAQEIAVKRLAEDRGEIFLEGRTVLKSRSLLKLVSGSQSLMFLAATAGSRIIRKIRSAEKQGRMEEAVVWDAAAGEITDRALDWLMLYYNNKLRRENLVLTKRRFSPGYGDLNLSVQKIIFRRLNLKKIGLKLTNNFQLVPEKSVTAIAGVTDPGR